MKDTDFKQNISHDFDKYYLTRALQLAYQIPLSSVKTNPRVGAVIVNAGKIIAEGAHQQFGGEHAEVTALKQLKDSDISTETTLYVTLEPCNHFGKTPPCTELIIERKISRVVIGCLDPNPLVAGKGVQRLQNAGIQVVVNDNQYDFQTLIKQFWVNQTLNRPFIILKWAQSRDGFIAKIGQKTTISSYESQIQTHYLRSQAMAILVGGNTARIDTPILNNRFFINNLTQPIIYSASQNFPTQQFHIPPIIVPNNPQLLKAGSEETIEWLQQLLKTHHIGSILVEGGTQTLNQFVSASLWDEAYRITAPISLENGIKAPNAESLSWKKIALIGEDCWEKSTNSTRVNK
ncbi:MAG: bifunctional diaminohydroxyphosphoribosylaminopyrimidine deaminase/5-amino-6-(5-phosphoribosylamino)uracil reductase RibD [Bacteroidia bacterium]|nr:bifunctional diaminohydroxyphosphoribosylaminopyrimidine deaminase/5-amino-6-(5-phosphoribosylamino)uracil reductase RibD [Bacteroidia bacterium]